MKQFILRGSNARAAVLEETGRIVSLFGLPGAGECPIPEGDGQFYLRTELGRFETGRWVTEEIRQEENTLTLRQRTVCGSYRLETQLRCHRDTGILSRRDSLTNCLDRETTVFSCMPRLTLQGDAWEVYGQYSGWCAENRGGWMPLVVGDLVLTDSDGRSTENAAPFGCIRSRVTGLAAAVHVLPVGDWMLRLRRLAGAATSYLVVEAGLSDRDLQLKLAPGETLALPELLLQGFAGEVESAAPVLQRYLLGRYPRRSLCPTAYNCWLYSYDELDEQKLRRQAVLAKELGCRVFVVDAGWFGTGTDWWNQVGNWQEATQGAFYGNMKGFADFVRSLGMGFGLWMEFTRATPDAPVYRAHPDWFLEGDAIIFDMSKPQVRQYLAAEVKRVVDTYGVVWLKGDYNLNMFHDRTGSNFYRYCQGEALLMEQLAAENPGCSFQGCASGGLRSDLHNAMTYYHGFDVSDTAHPLEALRMRQGYGLRMLPAYTAIWASLCQAEVTVGDYNDRTRRTMLLAGGDGHWHHAWQLSPDFMAKLSLLGETIYSGDLESFSEDTREIFRQSIGFYEAKREFLGRSVCHLLTPVRDIYDITGWACFQQENIDGLGSVLYAYRLVDDSPRLRLFPRGLEPEREYRVRRYGGEEWTATGEALMAVGIEAVCKSRYEGQVFELIPEAML